MRISETTVVAVATLSALLAGGGVLALTRPAVPAPTPIQRAADGHFWAEGETASGARAARIHFLVDTGASSVALTASDAARLGLEPERLVYSRPVFTAEGEVRAAPVILSRLTVAGVEVTAVKALVLKPGPRASLLGMSYLGRLSRIEATPETLTLKR